MLLINPIITIRQLQIIRGTILGGSSIIKPLNGRNAYLSMRCKNARWLEYKARELQSLTTPAPFTVETTYRWHSMCYPIFNSFRKEFYNNKKRILQLESLDPLQDIGLSIWYGDSGKIEKDCVVLCTHLWGEKGTKTIVDYFKLLGYHPQAFKERNCWRVRIDPKGSKLFLNLISKQL